MSPVPKTPEMPPIIVGTAGHVDHGKTSLTKLLTGCDTDRLKEEKERGMSIDLGFAPCRLNENRLIGFVDVPGHIDFIRNMVAGAASIDILILVIAADDGVMPQTVEHLQIIRLLRGPRLMVVLTKTDLVDPETVDFAKEEIASFLLENGYESGTVPILPVSCTNFAGIDAVRRELETLVASVVPVEDDRAFRMNIERIFQIKGFGTVVSGIPVSGSVRTGDTVEILPLGRKTQIRAIQNYKFETERTGAGICSALNLKHAEPSELSRGMTLAEPGMFSPVIRIVAEFSNISQCVEVKSGASLKFHAGTSETLARVLPIEPSRIAPGKTGFCRIRLAAPIVLAPGDRFILRKSSPSMTVGGGTVLSVSESVNRKFSAPPADRLRAAADSIRKGDGFAAEILACTDTVLARDRLAVRTRYSGHHANRAIEEKIVSGLLAPLGPAACLVVPNRDKAVAEIEKALSRYHQENPCSPGIEIESLARFSKFESADPTRLADLLVAVPDSPFRIAGGRFSLKSFSPRADHPLKGQILGAVRQTGMNCLALGNIQTMVGISEKELRTVIRVLVEEKNVIVVGGSHCISTEAFELCRQILFTLAEQNGTIGIAEFRDDAGIGRNIAVAILEKFDSLGFTRRYPDGRKIITPRKATAKEAL
jgi:selenocysteine-specific elongation factor